MQLTVRPASEAGSLIGAIKSQCAENDRLPEAEREWRLDGWKKGDAIVLVIEPTDSYWTVLKTLRAITFGALRTARETARGGACP